MKKPTLKRSAVEINKITGFIMGVRKFGKTTLWADMIIEKFGDPTRGLLISCGMEHGTNMIDNIYNVHINTYKELDEIKKWLISEKGKEHNIEMVCFDSAEEFFNLLEPEIIRRSVIENKKPCKSIKSAYNGFTNGEKECAKLAKEILNELYNAGIVPWAIGHTKLKNVKDKSSIDDEGFQRLGSSLISDYESVVADCFDIVVTGLVDREIEERGSGDTTKRYVKETERRLYFRGNEIVEAGGRLKDLTVPEFIPFDKPNMAKDFIGTVENALKAGRRDSSVVSTQKPAPVPVAEPIVEEDIDAEEIDLPEEEGEFIDEAPEIDFEALRTEIRDKFKTCKDKTLKTAIKAKIMEYGKLDDVPAEGLIELKEMIG